MFVPACRSIGCWGSLPNAFCSGCSPRRVKQGCFLSGDGPFFYGVSLRYQSTVSVCILYTKCRCNPLQDVRSCPRTPDCLQGRPDYLQGRPDRLQGKPDGLQGRPDHLQGKPNKMDTLRNVRSGVDVCFLHFPLMFRR